MKLSLHSKNHSPKIRTVVTLTSRLPTTLLKLHVYSPPSPLPRPMICSVETPLAEVIVILESLSFTCMVLFCTQVTEGVGTPPKSHLSKRFPPRFN
jgi:hypothetical protein